MPFKVTQRNGNRDEEVAITLKDISGIDDKDLQDSIANSKKAAEDAAAARAASDTISGDVNAIKETLASLVKKGSTTGGGGGDSDRHEEVDPAIAMSATAQKTALEAKIEIVKNKMATATDSEGNYLYPYWTQFEADIEKLVEKDPLVAKQNASYWENAYNIIVGRNIAKIRNGDIKAKQKLFIEGSSGNSHVNNGTKKDDEPSDIDKQLAAKQGIPIEKYMKSKQGLKFI